ncbi:MAG: hypothetical protein COA37_12180 [Hoeflea sp.]|uniref:hypothetical protein n=1 Tax=Hoeflea sp. TaxID=1940281 RepID=UPI000C12211C|nr:hypothetical protein [Hoeflea sp.]PHR22468.1 MAG: hypothetical protein COA37_12180 [Hoeflea sp.]
MSFMPSDFHPILLVLGHAEELLVLANALGKFAEQGGQLVLNDEGVHSTDTRVTLQQSDPDAGEKLGLWQTSPRSMDLTWRLPLAYARIFSDEVANLANAGEPAGSTTLECDRLGEIRVKVSIGEWEENYLTDGFR